MFASGHQTPALEALPRCSAQSAHTSRLTGKHVCSLSAHRRLQRQHGVTQKAQWHRTTVCQANTSPLPAIDKVDLDAKVAVVLGTQWGDEGKGKLVDILAQKYEIVARAQVGKPSIRCLCCLTHWLAHPTFAGQAHLYWQVTAEMVSLSLMPYRAGQMQATQYMTTRVQSMHCILCPLAF